MIYTANIQYVNNIERAGKLTLTGEDGSVLLSKVPIAMPDEILITPVLFEKIYSLSSFKVKLEDKFKIYDQYKTYEPAYKTLLINNPNGLFINNFGKAIIRPTEQKRMTNDDHAFVMHSQDFQVLYDILEQKKTLKIQTEKVSFLWLPDKVINSTESINLQLQLFQNIQNYLQSKMNSNSNKEDKSSLFELPKNKAKIQISPEVVQDKKISPNSPKQSVINIIGTNKNLNNNRNDLDALDVVIMYNSPELALFMKPTSTLAWFLHFNNIDRDDINKENVEKNVHKISGFEDVGSSEFKHTSKGYSVQLFEDENKTIPIGNIDFNKQKNCFEVVSENGETSLLTIGKNGELKTCFKATTGEQINMDLIKTNKGFIGNWESDNGGIVVKSGIIIDNNLDYSSTPNERNNISMSVMDSEKGYSSKQEETAYVNQTQSYEREKDYSPPPPPPPTNSWSSNDPYSQVTSFNM